MPPRAAVSNLVQQFVELCGAGRGIGALPKPAPQRIALAIPAQRLQRCVDASIAQMKRDTPALAGFDNAQPALVGMARASCLRQLGIKPESK